MKYLLLILGLLTLSGCHILGAPGSPEDMAKARNIKRIGVIAITQESIHQKHGGKNYELELTSRLGQFNDLYEQSTVELLEHSDQFEVIEMRYDRKAIMDSFFGDSRFPYGWRERNSTDIGAIHEHLQELILDYELDGLIVIRSINIHDRSFSLIGMESKRNDSRALIYNASTYVLIDPELKVLSVASSGFLTEEQVNTRYYRPHQAIVVDFGADIEAWNNTTTDTHPQVNVLVDMLQQQIIVNQPFALAKLFCYDPHTCPMIWEVKDNTLE
ncbi:hypothetical protein [Vibrio sp. WXL103]|uniref:hypothetical protein n=1 Tax=Vibrio sp. WXL103 TaxID=3450710 RepID=UPI003EC7E2C7